MTRWRRYAPPQPALPQQVHALLKFAAVLREMTAYGNAWRGDWSQFDGRQLRDQLSGIDTWANKMLTLPPEERTDYTSGTDFYKQAGE